MKLVLTLSWLVIVPRFEAKVEAKPNCFSVVSRNPRYRTIWPKDQHDSWPQMEGYPHSAGSATLRFSGRMESGDSAWVWLVLGDMMMMGISNGGDYFRNIIKSKQITEENMTSWRRISRCEYEGFWNLADNHPTLVTFGPQALLARTMTIIWIIWISCFLVSLTTQVAFWQ